MLYAPWYITLLHAIYYIYYKKSLKKGFEAWILKKKKTT
jgi:hypothetical protein